MELNLTPGKCLKDFSQSVRCIETQEHSPPPPPHPCMACIITINQVLIILIMIYFHTCQYFKLLYIQFLIQIHGGSEQCAEGGDCIQHRVCSFGLFAIEVCFT